MIGKHKYELEKLPDEIKHEINKCLEIYEELEKYKKGDINIDHLQKKLESILDKFEI